MIGKKKMFSTVFADLEAAAAKAKRKLHPSFKIELENYASHTFVKALPVEDLEVVLKGIGENAIIASGGKILGGDSVRTVIVDLCNDPFSDCSRAAINVLQRADRRRSAKYLLGKADKIYKGRGPL